MSEFDLSGIAGIVSVVALPMLFAITIHEVAHGWMARRCGDQTAYLAGRLTLNPIKHIDLVGTIVVPLALLFFTNGRMVFGWAKPVPVAFGALRRPQRDMILVAAAGPATNFAMALGWALVALLVQNMVGGAGDVSRWALGMSVFGIQINVILALFNLLPIPPLDGGRVLAGLLPPEGALWLNRVEPFGFMIVILLLMSGLLWTMLEPFMFFFIDFFWSVAGLG
jgi:Zn-dependent protease